MSRLSLIILLLLWTSCCIVQSSPDESQLRNALETDSYLEELANLGMTKANNHGNKSLENTTFEELPTISEEVTMKQTHGPLENENLFEGDLAIPEELIEEFYGNPTHAKRGAVRSNSRLWTSGRVYCRFPTGMSSNNKNIIHRAINHYQTNTCL